jgi:ABC-type multidrug transport system ATPase subunit
VTSYIEARGLELRGKRGPVFGPVDLDLPSPFSVLIGADGSGKTCLLLALSGRMKPSSGSATVLGIDIPRHSPAVLKSTGIAGFEGIDSLEDSVTVGAAVLERSRWESPWYSRLRRPSNQDLRDLLEPVFGDVAIPTANTVIWDLAEDQAMLLRIALACFSGPRILFVDNLDQVHERAARRRVIERLAAIAEAGTAVVATTSSIETDLVSGLVTSPTFVSISAPATAPTNRVDPSAVQEQLV